MANPVLALDHLATTETTTETIDSNPIDIDHGGSLGQAQPLKCVVQELAGSTGDGGKFSVLAQRGHQSRVHCLDDHVPVRLSDNDVAGQKDANLRIDVERSTRKLRIAGADYHVSRLPGRLEANTSALSGVCLAFGFRGYVAPMVQLPKRRPRMDYRRRLAQFALGTGPFLSIYLNVEPEVRESAGRRLKATIESHHIKPDPAVLEAQWAAAAAGLELIHDDDALLVTLIDGNGGSVTTGYPSAVTDELIEFSDLPRIGPLLAAEQRLVHHLIATLKGDTLTLTTVPRHGPTVEVSYGASDRLTIGPLVQHVVRESKTRLVILCGAAAELDQLKAQVQSGMPLSTAVTTIATDDRDADAMAVQIGETTAAHTASKTTELLRLWRFHQTHGEAVDGLDATLDALREHKAGLILLRDEAGDGRLGWYGPNPTDVFTTAAVDAADPAIDLRPGRLADVIVRAALAADYPLDLVPSWDDSLTDGVGAILTEHTDPHTLAELLER